MAFFLSILLRIHNLLFVVIIIPPTATFKGEHDGVGNPDKILIKDNEVNESIRCLTTRSRMPFLWGQDPMTPTHNMILAVNCIVVRIKSEYIDALADQEEKLNPSS